MTHREEPGANRPSQSSSNLPSNMRVNMIIIIMTVIMVIMVRMMMINLRLCLKEVNFPLLKVCLLNQHNVVILNTETTLYKSVMLEVMKNSTQSLIVPCVQCFSVA